MDTINKRRLAAAFVVAAGSLGTGVALAAGGSARSSGPDFTYGSTPFTNATASVHVVHTGNGGTHVTLHILGVDAPAGQTFGAHVHEFACGASGAAAGRHYQNAAAGALKGREVWLDFTVNADGIGHAEAKRPWSLDETIQRSVIIHARPTAADGSAGPRLACIDLDGQP